MSIGPSNSETHGAYDPVNDSHSLYSIKLDLVRAHVTANEPVLTDLEKRFAAILELVSYSDANITRLIEIRERTFGRWFAFDSQLDELLKKLAENPSKSIMMHRPNEEDEYIGYLRGADGSVHWDDFTESSKLLVARLDPDFVISSVRDVPEDQARIARGIWHEETMRTIRVNIAEIMFSVELEILWLELGAELTYRSEKYPDGRVRLIFAGSGKLGASLRGADVSAGGELGLSVMHEFGTQQEATSFLKELGDKLMSLSPDTAGAADLLLSNPTLESRIVSVGVYASADFGIPGWADVGAEASLRLGYARDTVADENIVYLDADCFLEVDDLPGTDSFDMRVAVSVEGAQHWQSNGDSYVDVQLSFSVTAGKQLELMKRLFPGAALSAGMGISARAYLELDHPAAVEAWENFRDPMDGSLDLAAFVEASTVTLESSTLFESEFVDVDVEAGVGSLEVEASGEIRATNRVWLKAPGPDERFEEVEI